MGTLVLATGYGAPIGAGAIGASEGIIAAGAGFMYFGNVLNRNIDNLSRIERPDGKGGINIYEGDADSGLKHVMLRHKFYSEHDKVSRFAKSMDKYDIKKLNSRSVEKRKKDDLKKAFGGIEEWQVNTGRHVGFGKKELKRIQ